jgi:hypothetical protein
MSPVEVAQTKELLQLFLVFVALPIHQAYFSALLWISLFSVLFFDGYHLGYSILESDNISPASGQPACH